MRDGQADVLDTAFRTATREKWLKFGEPYASMETAIFFHESLGNIETLSALKSFTVGVKSGGATTKWLQSHGVNNLREFKSYEAIIKAARNGEILTFCMETSPAMFFLYKYHLANEYNHSEPLYFGHFHWATHKNKAFLHQIISSGFKQISDEENKAILKKWLVVPQKIHGYSAYAKYFTHAVLIIAGLISALALLSWGLRRKVRSKTAELSSTLDELRSSEQYNRMLFENSMLGLCLCRLDGTIVDANQAFADIIGTSLEKVLQTSTRKITPKEYLSTDEHLVEVLLTEGQYGPCDKEYIHTSGKRIPVRIMGKLIEKGEEQLILSSVEDISTQKAAEERINFLAFHDALTGLPNRMIVRERLEQAFLHANRFEHKVALLFLDLDNFKSINDTLGHSVGDKLLIEIGARLTSVLRQTDTVCRQGGDEFLIILPDLSDTAKVAEILDNIMQWMRNPFVIYGHELNTSFSVGVAIYPEDGDDFDTLMKNADIAMYQAKDFGRNTYRFFDAKMHADAITRMQLGNALRRALENNELFLQYQPLINLASGKIIGAEALLRWQHPKQGLIPPEQFIPIAESTGLIVPIGEWVLHIACQQAAEWHRAGWVDLQMAVNLSGVQFRRSNLEQTILTAIQTSGIDPNLLELELTESILLEHVDHVLGVVQKLKSHGVKLSIDDFGTGYSSLSYLKRFAVDKLKIDRSFIRDLSTDPDDEAIVQAIIQMAQSLDLKILAEGVETDEILARLRKLQCDEAQGYLFARPMSATDFAAYLEKSSADT